MVYDKQIPSREKADIFSPQKLAFAKRQMPTEIQVREFYMKNYTKQEFYLEDHKHAQLGYLNLGIYWGIYAELGLFKLYF